MKLRALLLACVCLPVLLSGCAAADSKVTLGNVVILGDSYSTFENSIPEGYASWYSEDAGYTDVNRVEQTWWHQLIAGTNSTLLCNASYSGTTICHTGYDGEDVSQTSFVGRMNALIDANYFRDHQVDTLIIYGGLNDYWANAPMGELKYENWTEEDLYAVLPAFTFLLKIAKENLPEARILFVLEEYLGQEMKDSFTAACHQLDVEIVAVENISKTDSHPDAAGMTQIATQIMEYLEVAQCLNEEH